jgi:transaldolase/glucose-6-phosphate isomerase
MSRMNELESIGQSIWLDYIRRSFLESGELQRLINEGLKGITSNPSIFEKVISGSADYDEDIQRLIDENRSFEAVYEALAIKDVLLAAEQLRPVYDATDSRDGYVSLEVPPHLAHEAEKTISEAIRLFTTLNQPNIMIKIPATEEGIPAIRELISSGINVNATLIFDLDTYRAVVNAYLEGLEDLAQGGPSVDGGHTIDRIASIASFSVSGIDTAVDVLLEQKGNRGLLGKIAIANARVAYREFQKIFSGTRWEALKARGARLQRLSWISTGTKNPAYPDTLYVDELIGTDTVSTVTPTTLNNFLDHGTLAEKLTDALEEAEYHLHQLSEIGIDLGEITRELQNDGIAAFAQSFQDLITSIAEKKERLKGKLQAYSAHIGEHQAAVDSALLRFRDERIMHRIWEHDHTVWKEKPTEIVNRLGWLHSPEIMTENIPIMNAFVDEVRSSGFTHALLLGMGGSSLAPEVFRFTFGVRSGYLDLSVLDSTDPGAVLERERSIEPGKTLFIVSTKSGGTVETLSFMKYFYQKTIEISGRDRAGDYFIAITDPGSGLESAARELHFRKIFLNDPNIGGRYSALSYFGLVPAALIGIELDKLLARAASMGYNCEGNNCPVAGDNTGAWLGAIIGEAAKAGRDKITLVASPPIQYFDAWLEQLIAESTGKEGKGILPVCGEDIESPDAYAHDRLFVYIRLDDDSTYDERIGMLAEAGRPVVQLNLRDMYDLGGELFRWEIATAVAGMLLGINPFEQPDVESAKVLARDMVAAYREKGSMPELTPSMEWKGIKVYSDITVDRFDEILPRFLARIEEGKKGEIGRSYVALQAYVKPDVETDEALYGLRSRIQNRFRVATTVGYGPRFLHSTGQLHKGDAGHGLFIQFTADMPEDIAIPDDPCSDESSISFGILKTAQAMGDRQALLDAGRTVIRFDLGRDISGGLKRILETIR